MMGICPSSFTLGSDLRRDEVEELLQLRQALSGEDPGLVGGGEGQIVSDASPGAAFGLVPPGGLVWRQESLPHGGDAHAGEALHRAPAEVIFLFAEETRDGAPELELIPIRTDPDVDVSGLVVGADDPAVLVVDGAVGIESRPLQRVTYRRQRLASAGNHVRGAESVPLGCHRFIGIAQFAHTMPWRSI